MGVSKSTGNNEQREHATDDEGSNKEGEGGKDDGTDDEGGGRATATRVKKQVRAARATATAMATWVAGDKEGDGNDGKGK